MKNINIILSTFILAFFTLSCSSDDDSGLPDPGGDDGFGSFEYDIEGVGSYTSTPADGAFAVYSTDPEETEIDEVTGVYIISTSGGDADHVMNITLYEINGDLVTTIDNEADNSSGAYISHSDNKLYFSVSGQIEVLHASHGPLNGNNFATAKVQLNINGQFMSFDDELLRDVSGSVSADRPPLYYPGL
ncbi:MAG: hypothetical protein ACTHY4_09105 [Flavobacteriaceae bacterium]|nr:hypothetical protein [Psychroflexus sp.]